MGTYYAAVVDVSTGKRTQILHLLNDIIVEPRLSKDGRWIAFEDTARNLYIAPFRGAQLIPESDRIRVATQSSHPVWACESRHGAIRCRQKLDPASKMQSAFQPFS